MIKAIIFDFFDVIYTDALAEMLRKRGRNRGATIEEASRALDMGFIDTDTFFKRLALVFGESATELRAECLTYNILNKDLLPILEYLSGRYRVGLLSNASKDFLRGLLQSYGLERFFHSITISSEVGMAKPDPAIFEYILARLNVEPDQTIFVDDNPKNILAANGLGIKGIIYSDIASLRNSLQDLGITLPAGS